MLQKKRRMKIRQRQLRRKKKVSFQRLSPNEAAKVAGQEREGRGIWQRISWVGAFGRDLHHIQLIHGIKFGPVIEKLKKRFPNQKIEVLDEGAGKSSLKQELMYDFNNLNVTTADIRDGSDKRVNVVDLVKAFGKNKFHLVISTFGGARHTPLPEKAFFQLASVLQPGGIGIIGAAISKERCYQLAKGLMLLSRKLKRT